MTEYSNKISKAVIQALEGVSEALDLSKVLGPPNPSETLPELHTRLVQTRARHQRLAELLGTLIRVNADVKKNVIDAQEELLEAEGRALSEKRGFGEDFSSAQERNARLGLKTLEERRSLNELKKLELDVGSALEFVRLKHRSLGDQVADVNSRLRIITLDGSWDLSQQ